MNHKIMLDDEEVPTHYYNLLADLPFEMPPAKHPKTGEPITPDDLIRLFPRELIMQEVSKERQIRIPEEVREAYKIYRPTPLIRAVGLEKALGTPAKIYYKYEGASPSGSHKLNTALAQAYYNKKEGTEELTTETGAGQWGTALSIACRTFGLKCRVYMVRSSFEGKPYRKTIMRLFGAEVIPSPSDSTAAGRQILEKNPDTPGSLGIAISEAVEAAVTTAGARYALGSVLNHVLLHQTIIGQEAKKQLRKDGAYPDVIIGCVGGGSNFAGIAFPFIKDRLSGKQIEFIAVEPTACPSLTKGRYEYDYGDASGMAPLLKMYTLGHDFIPDPIHAGGLRYHGMSPMISLLYSKGLIEAVAVSQKEVFEAAHAFAMAEGIVPAPESAHAIRAVIDKANECRKQGKKKTILFNLSGHGYLDLAAYADFLDGKIK